ncbi:MULTISPECIES: FHIPEP family type III secretion protein [Xanthomonas]|uniref:FHIPEP family type III secretion protein n=1 Tax=Xanthomonas TaxID=338 RepID=UPI00096FF78F|nr:FHIPEP family type III secretion protein [Xanthomonas campestris]MCC5095028.1 FHIPEP family type III secretion protein [Xanthomonas campestris pv. incanae]MEA9612488.1 FHIPEP family type III secretion protein [Xanthomonas campestris pv. incanae]MEA9621203.1 FHIPEP family type III secretion protein [Xanthomonas campestris pv. incanae]RFF40373.1 EscV/YscV/HrcV family type III secretion system export apparatus protein [Xanthomonas campestris pv. incanae]WDJ11181.1 FHIPEP family type III secret
MRVTRYFAYTGEVAIAALVVAVIGLMILPLPTPLIDTLLGINITLSVVLLMVTMYVPDSISLSSFPSLLLFTTLLRLSLNIASTKSILLHAEAGHIIESFGELVVGGNLVVGLVVFLIITTVQFIVIAKGSERVAEVGARFTLDAMPGKQMSIDADLRGGNLTADEARRKRARLAIESQLHGGMDGAMKFVKGDAIAGLVITMVNILAGIVVGVTYHGMSAGEAANRFAILSVGDAMVSQIASLLISVAAGVMITRVANENETKISSLGLDIGRQLTSNARALMAASVLLACFAFVPGFPALLFLLLAAAVGAGGYTIWRKQRDTSGSDQPALPSTSRKGAKGDAPHIRKSAPDFASPLSMRLSPQLAARLDPALLDQAIESERRQLVELLGLPFPGIAIWQSESLQGLQYEVLIHDVPETRAELNDTADMQKALAQQAIAPLHARAHLFVGIQETQWMLEQVGADYPGLVAEVNKAMPAQRIADVLRRLLEERVPVRNIKSILESLVVWGPKEKDLLMLTEYVRCDLGRYLAHTATAGTGQLPAVMLDHAVEQLIRQSIRATPAGNFLALPPEQASQLVEQVERIVGDQARHPLAVVASMDVRRYVRRMIEARLGWLEVYSFQELGAEVQLQPIGRVVA